MKNKSNYVIGGLIILLAIIIILWIITIKQGEMPYLDQWTRGFVQTVAETPIYSVFRWITELGSKTFVEPMTIVMTIIFWISFKDFRPAFIFGFGVLGTHVINNVVKELVARERPSISIALNAEGYSFPSGHAMVSIVCYGLLAYFIGKKCHSDCMAFFVRLAFALIIMLIGLSRYIINVHFLTDILTGYVIGFMILVCLMKLYEGSQAKKKT